MWQYEATSQAAAKGKILNLLLISLFSFDFLKIGCLILFVSDPLGKV